ncbi:YadA-like family protein [Lonepinella sp. BR2474]|uniref:YadA-like family protein n=1 Tax=Lonepinella sp. BR2474 TaxID=3434548 RepID=UPI003F6E29A2
MNKIFRVIWNASIGAFVVTSELGKAKGKTKSSSTAKVSLSAVAIAVAGTGLMGATIGTAQAADQWVPVYGTVDNLATSGGNWVAQENATYGIAIGEGSEAHSNAIVIGKDADAQYSGIAVGNNASANTSAGPSVAVGLNANASGAYTVAIGHTANASEVNAVSIGYITNSTNNGVAIGAQAKAVQSDAGEQGAIAVGAGSNASQNQAVAVGQNSKTESEVSTAIGGGATVEADARGSVAIGQNAHVFAGSEYSQIVGWGSGVTGDSSNGFGTRTSVTGDASNAFGANTSLTGNHSNTLGNNNTIKADDSTAVGYNNTVTGNNTVVLGNNVTAADSGSVVLGDGSTGSPATPEKFVDISGAHIEGFSGVVAEGDSGNYVSVGNATDPRQIKYVASGNISAGSTDAINGSQLYAVTDYLLNMGWELQENGTTEDKKVKQSDVINFVNGTGTTAVIDQVADDGNGNVTKTNITYNVNTDGKTIKLDGNNITAVTSDITPTGTNKTAVATTGDSLVNASTVAGAVNNVSLNFAGNSGGTVNRKNGETLNVVGTMDSSKTASSHNINTAVTNESTLVIQFAESPVFGGDLTANTLTSNGSITGGSLKVNGPATVAGDFTVTPYHVVDMGNNRIQNVSNGTQPNDAVALQQLTDNISNVTALAKAAEETVTGTHGVNVTNSTNTTTGGTDYVVKALTDDKTITVNTTTGNLEAVTSGTTTNNNGRAETTNGGGIVNATTLVNTVNNAFHTVAVGETKQAITQGGSSDPVKAGDTVTYVAGQNLVSNIATSGTNTNITYDLAENITVNNITAANSTLGNTTVSNFTVKPNSNVDMGNNQLHNVKAGTEGTDAVNLDQLNATTSLANAANENITGENGILVTNTTNPDGSSNYTVKAVTTTLTPDNTGKVAVTSGGNATDLMNASSIAAAINNSGFVTTSAKTGTGEVSGTSNEVVNPGETVTLTAGDNIKVVQNGANFTVQTTENVKFNNLTAANSTLGNATATNLTTGNLTVSPNGNIDMGNNKIHNVTAGTDDTDAVNVSQLKEVKNTADSALQNFTTSVNGEKAETIDKTNTDINFINGNATTARSDNGNLTFDVKTDGSTVTIKDGNVSAVTTAVGTTDAGKADAGDKGSSLVNASSVADAINNAYFTAVSKSTTDQVTSNEGSVQIGAGDKISYVAGKNLEANITGDVITYGLSQDIDVRNVNATTVEAENLKGGNLTIDSGSNIDMGGNQIHNVSNGTSDNDAVNLSQLNATTATAKAGNENITGTHGVNVTNVSNTTSGGYDYVVTAKTDDKTITVNTTTGNLEAVTSGTTTNNNGRAETTNGDGIVNATTLVNTVNNAFHTINVGDTQQKVVQGGSSAQINPGDTVSYVSGKNLVANISTDGTTSKVTYDLADDITVNNITAANSTLGNATATNLTTGNLTVSPDGNINMGGNQIHNVKAGTEDTDAVNVSQLKEVNTTANSAIQNFTTSVNGQVVETITKDNKDVNFVNGTGTTAAADGQNIKYNVNTDGSTIKVNSTTNNLEAVTAGTSVLNNGSVSAGTNGGSLVNASTLADAINGAYFTAASKSTTDQVTSNEGTVQIGAGDKITYVAGKNLEANISGDTITYGLSQDIDVRNVNATTVKADTVEAENLKGGNLTIDSGSNIDMGGNQIHNVSNGTSDNDAVNLSQLNATTATAKAGNEQITAEHGVVVTNVANTTSGGYDYVVSAKTDDKTITVNATTGNLEAITSGTTTNDNGRAETTNGAGIVNATTLVDTVNNAFHTVAVGKTTDTVVQGGKSAQINPGDTVNYVAGSNLVANISTDGTTSNVTYDLAKDITVTTVTAVEKVTTKDLVSTGNTTVHNFTVSKDSEVDMGNNQVHNVSAGTADTDAVNVSQLKTAESNATKAATAADENITGVHGIDVTEMKNADGSSNYTVKALTDDKTITVNTDGNLAAVTGALDNTTNSNGSIAVSSGSTGDNLVNASTVANAINSAYFTATSKDTDDQVVSNEGSVKINAGDSINYIAGKNLEANITGDNITYGLSNDIDVNSVKANTVEAENLKGGNLTIDAGSTIDMGGNQINNVAAGTEDGDAVNVKQLNDTVAKNKTYVEGDQGVTVTPIENANGTTTYNVSAKTDGTTVTINAAGQLEAKTATLGTSEPTTSTVKVTAPDGTVTETTTTTPGGKAQITEGDKNNLVTAGDVVTAINNAYYTVTSKDTDDQVVSHDGSTTIKAGDEVTYVAGKNLEANIVGDTITYGLSSSIDVDTVTAKDLKGGNLTIDAGSTIDMGGNQINNVGEGVEDGDAVNVKQLNDTVAKNKTYVEGDQGVTVTPKTNDDGSTTYNVSAKTDDKTITVNSTTGNLEAITSGTTTTSNGQAATENGAGIVNATTLVKAVNEAYHTIKVGETTQTVTQGGDSAQINAGDTVTYVAGKNLVANISTDGTTSSVTYDLAKDIAVNSTTIGSGDNTTRLTSTGDSLSVGGDKITGVANGDISATSTDAVNGSQLYNLTKSFSGELTFAGNNATNTTTKKLGDTVVIKGELAEQAAASGKNVIVDVDSNGDLVIKIAENPTFNSVHADDNMTVGTKTTIGDGNATIGNVEIKDDGQIDGVKAATLNSTSQEAVNGSQLYATNQNVSNLSTEVAKGWNITTTGNTTGSSLSQVAMGNTVTFDGGKNIELTQSGNSVSIATSMNPTFTSVTSQTVHLTDGNGGGVALSNVGNDLKVADANGNAVKITNVAPGTEDTDAVNVSQLKAATQNGVGNIANQVNKLDKRVRGIGASSAASSSLPQVFIPGKSMVAAAGGAYSGASAIAVGYSRASDNGKLLLKLTGTANSEGHYSGGVGIGYQW